MSFSETTTTLNLSKRSWPCGLYAHGRLFLANADKAESYGGEAITLGLIMVDVGGLEPPARCLQSREGKTLNGFVGVAYMENQQNSRSLTVPKLSRTFRYLDLPRCRGHPAALPTCQFFSFPVISVLPTGS